VEIYTGIDIVDLKRFQQILQKYKRRFINRLFTDKELSSIPHNRDTFHLLGISFSFKEAIWKALPEEMQKNFYFKDIEILWCDSKPAVALKEKTNPAGLTFNFYTTDTYAVTIATILLPVFSLM